MRLDSDKIFGMINLIKGIFHIYMITEMDEAAAWWASVVTVAVYWLMGDDENAERCFSMVDTYPKKFQSSE